MKVLKFVTERIASKNNSLQCRRIKALCRIIGRRAKGSSSARATAQRQNANETGGTRPCIPLPMTKFPDQNNTVNVSST
jgi:hypothetical protein